jgi:hypothetical protein
MTEGCDARRVRMEVYCGRWNGNRVMREEK